MTATLCPACRQPGLLIVGAIYEPRRAPVLVRLLTLGLIGMVRARTGYDGFCAHCGERYCCGNGGPHDTWRRQAKPRTSELSDATPERRIPERHDPAADSLMRTERDFAR